MQSQLRNYVLFFVSFIVIYGGYFYVRNHFWPPPKKLTLDEYAAVDKARQLLAAPTGSPADAARVAVAATQVTTSREQADEFIVAARKEQAEKLAAAKPPEPPPPAPKPDKPAELLTLGDREDYHLRVVLTNRGAGVHSLTLSKFKSADWYGLPERTADKKPVPLELIPPGETPSFAVYHYEKADEPRDKARPLDTLGKRDWRVVDKQTDGDEQRVAYATDLPEFGVRVVKTFTLRSQEYHLGLSVKVERLADAKATVPFRYQLAGGRGLPIEGVWYTNIFRNAIFYWTGAKEERNLIDSKTVALKGGSDESKRNPGTASLQYAAVAIQYFASAVVVSDEPQAKTDFIEFVRATDEEVADPQHRQLDDITVRTIAEPVEPKAGEPVEHKYVLYHGPIKVRLLEQLGGEGGVSPELTHRYETTLHLNTLTDYGSFSGGFFSFWTNAIIFFTNIVHAVIGLLRKVSPWDGINIILVTVMVRLVMLPLSRRQAASMAKTQEGMAKLKPELARIKERYKNDLVQQQQETMALYRKHGINPAAGLGGCLMLILQMPIFLGLYFALQESFFFRLEPFLWIRNLAAPDMLCAWVPGNLAWSESIWFIATRDAMGTFFYLGPFFNILPVVALALMFFQMKYMQPPPADEQMAQQQKMMQYIMIPMFAFLFYKMPAGLCLYFIATTLWGLAERKWFVKKKPTGPDAETVEGNGRPGPKGKTKAPPPPPPGRIKSWWQRVLDEAAKDPTTRRRK